MKKIKILIADDHPIFRSGVKDVLSKIDDFEIIAEAENGLKAYQQIISLLPDIAVLDLEMPLLSGLDVAKKVLSEKHQTEFVVLTMHKDKHFFLDAIQTGVKGYLLKDNAVNDLAACVKAVVNGNKFVSEQLKYLLNEAHQHEKFTTENKQLILLTPTEKVILKLIKEGKTSPEIAALLIVSPNTIENHRSNMSKKLNLDGGKNALLKFAMQLKDVL